VLTVTAATLQSIAVTPASPSIAKGLTQQFTATGTYSDSSDAESDQHGDLELGTTTVATITRRAAWRRLQWSGGTEQHHRPA
jgi:hypothetical protein